MAPVEEMLAIDFVPLLLSILVIIAGLKVIVGLFEWFCTKFGIELKSQRQKREDHEMLISTAKKLSELQVKHSEDVAAAMEHDKKIKDELTKFTQEIHDSILQTQEQMKQFQDNRVNDRAQSFKIQKELQDSLASLSNKLDVMKEVTDSRFLANETKQNNGNRMYGGASPGCAGDALPSETLCPSRTGRRRRACDARRCGGGERR